MMLAEDNEIVREEEIIANTMNNNFTNITTHHSKANLKSMIDTFQNHESVQRIKLANFHCKSSLKYNIVRELDVKKEILNFPPKKLPEKVIFHPTY